MSAGTWDIDAIVREVLQRLEQLAAPSRSETAPAAAVPHESGPDRQELRLTNRVVTLATVEGRLRGIHRVIASRTAVITPSVRDLLRRQDIALLREEPAARGDSTVTLALVAAEVDYDPNRLAARVAAAVATSAASSLREAVMRAAAAASDRQRLTVLLTRRTALALCLANRHRALRATWAENVETVRETKRAIGANVLVIDPTKQTDDALADLIGEFLHDAPHACPKELQG